jgi:hypothetical protein
MSIKEVDMKMTSLSFVKLAVAAAIALCVSVTTASAQPALEGSFTLPYEVHWGKAVLTPGVYTVTFDSMRGPAIVRTSTGQGRVILLPVPTDKSLKDQPSALIVSRIENERVVRYLNVREKDLSFVYRPYTKTERKLVGSVDKPEAVAILMAQK